MSRRAPGRRSTNAGCTPRRSGQGDGSEGRVHRIGVAETDGVAEVRHTQDPDARRQFLVGGRGDDRLPEAESLRLGESARDGSAPRSASETAALQAAGLLGEIYEKGSVLLGA